MQLIQFCYKGGNVFTQTPILLLRQCHAVRRWRRSSTVKALVRLWSAPFCSSGEYVLVLSSHQPQLLYMVLEERFREWETKCCSAPLRGLGQATAGT